MFRFILLVWTFAAICSSCFINNCPPGGKRSGNAQGEIRQCTACGRSGQCYGANICCSKEFGCLIGTPETAKCAIENQLMEPCLNAGVSCGGNDSSQPINGHCAADGICCSTESCTIDANCVAPSLNDEDCVDGELSLEPGGGFKTKVIGYGIPGKILHQKFPHFKIPSNRIPWSSFLSNYNNKRFYFNNVRAGQPERPS